MSWLRKVKAAFIKPHVQYDSRTGFYQTNSAALFVGSTSVSAVEACIGLLTRLLSRLTWRVYENRDGILYPVDHDVNFLLRQPYVFMDRYSYYEYLFRQLYTFNNAYARIERTSSGAPLALVPYPSDTVYFDGNGTGTFRYQATDANGSRREIVFGNMVHLHVDEYDPRANVSINPESTGLGITHNIARTVLAALRSNVNNGVRPGGYLATPYDMNDKQVKDKIKEIGGIVSGIINSGSLFALPNEVEFKEVRVPTFDAGLINLAEWAFREIATAFGIPLPLLHSVEGKYNSNLEEHWSSFLSTTLLSHVQRIGSQLSFKLIRPEQRLRNNLEISADTTSLHVTTLTQAANVVNTLGQSGSVELDEMRRILIMLNLIPKPDGLTNPPQTAGAPPRENNNNGADNEQQQNDV